MTPGAVCLLCRAAAAAANASIAAHIDSLPYDDLVKLKGEVADALRTKWTSVVTIEEPLDLNALPDSVVKNVKMPKKDFSSLRQKYGIDKLLVIDVASLGISRTYSSYIPTSDPKVVLAGMGYMIDLQSNSYDRVVPLNAARAAEGGWDEPPKYPGLTNAYFQVLELTRDRVLKTFGN